MAKSHSVGGEKLREKMKAPPVGGFSQNDATSPPSNAPTTNASPTTMTLRSISRSRTPDLVPTVHGGVDWEVETATALTGGVETNDGGDRGRWRRR